MNKKRMRDNLRLINDVQAAEYDENGRVIRRDSVDVGKFHNALDKRYLDRRKSIGLWGCMMAPVVAGLVVGSIGAIDKWANLNVPQLYSVIILLFVFLPLACVMTCSYLMDSKPKGFDEALSAWYDGAYRESTWYQGLSDEEKANAIGIIESKAYSLISERLRDMQSTKYNMKPVVSMLDRAIRNDRTILDSDMVDIATRDKLRGMITLYESYRSTLDSNDRTETIPFITQGMTDLMQDDEKMLINAVDAYNNEVNLTATNVPRINEYKAMLRRYRETLIHHQHYHAGHPTSQAISDAESLAYAGFTM